MMKFSGIWHIYEMGNWNEDYFNMEVQAYIEINEISKTSIKRNWKYLSDRCQWRVVHQRRSNHHMVISFPK